MKKVFLLGILATVLLLAACSPQELYMCSDGTPGGGQFPTKSKVVYFCPDGTETLDIGICTFEKEIFVTQKDAELSAINFVNGYVRASGWIATLINAYAEDGDFYSQVVISKTGEQSYETLVKIDGVKGIATCEENCVYTAQIG